MTTDGSVTEETTVVGDSLAVKQDNEKAPEDTEQAVTKSAVGECPDGGLAAWLVVFGTWCCSFCSFGWINSKIKHDDSKSWHLLS